MDISSAPILADINVNGRAIDLGHTRAISRSVAS
jgi:hypothetical protein